MRYVYKMEGGRRRTRHRRHSRRGGMSTADENRFLEQKRKEREQSLDKVGYNARKAPLVIQGVGTESRKPSPLAAVVDMRTQSARDEAKAGRRKTRRRKSHRRR